MSDRGVSTVLGFVLTLTITTLLLSGLLIATGDTVRDRNREVTREELTVVGEQIAADIQAADRLAKTGADQVVVRTTLPATVASGRYQVEVDAAPGGSELVLTARDVDVTVTVPFANTTAVRDTTVNGGDVSIRLVSGELEVTSA